jgi:hypothetical protein
MRYVLRAILVYPAWMAMMTLHEAGHVLNALTSGGRVTGVTIPLLGFSRTDLSLNPHPLWVAWGGPVWGCLFAVAVLVLAGILRRFVIAARLFAGFCLIANGAYIGLGGLMTAGDGHDLLRHGAPGWSLILFGAVALTAGLWLWHRAGATSASSLSSFQSLTGSPASAPPSGRAGPGA